MSSNSPFQYGGDASGSNSYSAYSPPGTSGGYLGGGGYEEDSGRPMTSAGRKGGDGNPFRQLTEQQKQQQQAGPPPTYDPNSSTSRNPYASPPPQSSYGYDSYGGKPPQSSYGYGAGASYGGPPPQSSYGYGYDDSSRGHGLEEEEEEDESDAEDVFAFLPPTTAEVEEERKQKERQEREREEYERRRREQEQAQVMQHAHLLGAAGLRHSMSQSQSQARSQQPFASSSTQGQLKEEESRRVREEPATFAFTVDSADSAGYSGSTAKRPPPTGTTDGDYGVYQAREHERHMQTQYPRYGVETPYQGVYRYDPPVSPPSTESTNSFDVIASRHPSRAGAGEKADKGDEGGGGYRMTRLDPRKSLEREEREKKEREEKGEDESVTVTASFDANKDSPVLKEGDITDVTLDPDTLVVRQNADGTPTLNKEKGRQVDEEKQDEDLDELQAKKKEKAPLGSGGGSFGKHWEHFQPNPSRFNSNSGPYKRHREYHYNQAYPQYANTGRTTARSDTEGDNSSTPLGGMTAVGVPEGRSRRRRKRGKSSQGPGSRQGTAMADERLGTAVTEGTNYLAGSEYTGDRPVSSGRLGTGHASLGYLEKASRSELEEYQEQRDDHPDDPDEYDDYEDDYDAESREGSIKMEFDFDAIEDEDSPYPEVRASVSNIDDPDMPAMTIRMWVIGLLLCMTASAINVFFNFRSPAPSIIPLVLLLLSYPVGKFLAFTLPITTYRIPLPYLPSSLVSSSAPMPLQRLLRPLTFPHAVEFSLNPGPWNIKEHVLVYIMANVAVGSPYALNAIVVLEVFYEFKTDYWFSLVLVLATQLTGFGLAGMCRRFLVWPASMVWPQNLVACTLLNTLHAEDEDDGIGMLGGPTLEDDPNTEGGRRRKRGMSRYKFFIWTTIGSFLFFFLPGYLFEALSIFSFVCWAVPDNVVVNQLFGVRSGLGMSMLTFDWSQITWIGSPLMVPWWAEVHVFAGFVLFYWIMTPILYYTNSWQLAYFPISDTSPYDRFGERYNVARVLKNDDTFDVEAYNAYSPLFLPATYAVTYLLAFALSTCVIVHTLLYHGHTLLNGFKKIRVENDDIHAKLMRNYPEVPDWWYLCSFGVFFALAIVAVEIWDTSVPVWALLLSVVLPVLYILPSGFIYAMTGQGINLNILAQIIPGTLLPGQPLANMVFKAYSVQTLAEATNFVQDLKLGHYVKVPPRATFLVQMTSTTLAAFIQVGVKHWIFTNVPDICTKDQPSSLTCPHNQVFFTASAVWGLIGPDRQFGKGSIYHPHLYAIIIGVFLPLPFWLWRRRYPNSWVKWVSTPVVLNGVSWIPPATGINYSSWFMVGFLFQYIVRKKNFAWWSKFNYVLSSALDSGTVIAVIVIFFTLQFPKGGFWLEWWGNDVFRRTADFEQRPYLPIPEGGIPWGS